MLEYELKRQLDLANALNEKYERLVEILNNDVKNRDNLIAAQKDLIKLYGDRNKQLENLTVSFQPLLLPPPRFPFWGW